MSLRFKPGGKTCSSCVNRFIVSSSNMPMIGCNELRLTSTDSKLSGSRQIWHVFRREHSLITSSHDVSHPCWKQLSWGHWPQCSWFLKCSKARHGWDNNVVAMLWSHNSASILSERTLIAIRLGNLLTSHQVPHNWHWKETNGEQSGVQGDLCNSSI
jgi:hypothetical protein